MSKDPAIIQLEAWKDIIQSPSWRQFKDFVRERIIHFEKQTCIAVKNGKFNEAMKYQAIAEDWKKIVGKVDDRIKELGNSIEKED